MTQENIKNGKILTARIIHIAMIVAVIIYSVVLYLLITYFDIQIFTPDDPELQIIELIVGIVAIISIIIGYILPLGFVKFMTINVTGILSIHLLRLSLLGSGGALGLILGVISAEWQIPSIFFILSAVALVLTFPTKTKWEKMLEKYGNKHEKNTGMPKI